MAEGRARKTGQHDEQLIRALADAAEAKKAVAELSRRVERLEAEIALLRAQLTATGSSSPSIANAKRGGPPPLPASHAASGPVRRQSKGVIDVSDVAELLEAGPIVPPRGK